jgi:hypothetical protein
MTCSFPTRGLAGRWRDRGESARRTLRQASERSRRLSFGRASVLEEVAGGLLERASRDPRQQEAIRAELDRYFAECPSAGATVTTGLVPGRIA